MVRSLSFGLFLLFVLVGYLRCLVRALPEAVDSLAQGRTEFRQFAWSQDNEGDDADENDRGDFDAVTSLNIAEFDAASNNSVDDIRTLRENVRREVILYQRIY